MSKLFGGEPLKCLGQYYACLFSEYSSEIIIFWPILQHVIPEVTQVKDQLHQFLISKGCRVNRFQQVIESAINVMPDFLRDLLLLLGMQEEHSAQEDSHLG